MITAHANSGLDALHTALSSADTQLEHISTRLQSELSLNHPHAPTNPYELLKRLRDLQTDLPAFREQLLTIHQQKADLVARCRTDLDETTRFARSVLPVAAPSGTDPRSVDEELSKAEKRLSSLLADFRRVNAGFMERNDVKDQDLNLALLRAAADMNIDTPEAQQEVEKVEQIETEEPEEEKKPPEGKREKLQKIGSGNKKVEVTRPCAEFTPVSKAVFNRLPRNLKVKAGKLPQVNDFYEKVFNALKDVSDPLSNAELKSATGEEDMFKFEVLRGLAVLRHTKDGWLLPS